MDPRGARFYNPVMAEERCPACDQPTGEGIRYCPACGESIRPFRGETVTLDEPPGPIPDEPDPEEERATLRVETETFRLQLREQQGLIRIPSGSFTMGSPASEPGHGADERQHSVQLSRPFDLGRAPVTQAQYRFETAGARPSLYPGEDRPVEQVTWFEAIACCNALSLRSKLPPAYTVRGREVSWDRESPGFRLPTEAEWEYATRAGQPTLFSGADELDAVAWWRRDGNAGTAPVCRKAPNAWGLHDMTGNVWEWCWDVFASYPDGPVTDPVGPAAGAFRVNRGGSWGEAEPRLLRVAARDGNGPDARQSNLGFRIARTLI